MWLVLGDLCLYHDVNGLSGLRRTKAPVRIVVLDNGGGGIFEFLPQAGLIDRDEFEALFGTPSGVAVERIAALHEIPYRRIDDLDDLRDLPRETRVIAEIPVDRRENVTVHRRIAEAVADAMVSATST
jgi:2-succinyl-5-enolpyruvyl-6-hydroxy-3-cyclohexene-1-carboxylate synthase